MTAYSMATTGTRVVCFATKGAASNEESRIVQLLHDLDPEVWAFDRAHKARSALRLAGHLQRTRPALVVMEGTGTAGGAVLLAARVLLGIPFVVSSGDAVAPFLAARRAWLWPAAFTYEWLLYRLSAGFIGWTPYLTGRALTLGAPRAVTAPGFAPFADASDRRAAMRDALGIPQDALVFGIVGALVWTPRRAYCYGLELVRALSRVARRDVRVLIVGDGDGRQRLERLGDERVVLTGAVPQEQVPAHLAAMDVASLPQSVDRVGAFRYTTKVSEYLDAGLPIVSSRIPAAYDLDDGWVWRLPGRAPWAEEYVAALAELMETMTPEKLAQRRDHARAPAGTFALQPQQRRVGQFIAELIEDGRR